jgi:hypothetical protein
MSLGGNRRRNWDDDYGRIIRVLILTAARRGEVGGYAAELERGDGLCISSADTGRAAGDRAMFWRRPGKRRERRSSAKLLTKR